MEDVKNGIRLQNEWIQECAKMAAEWDAPNLPTRRLADTPLDRSSSGRVPDIVHRQLLSNFVFLVGWHQGRRPRLCLKPSRYKSG
jgi:hypothetical protein